MDRFGIQRCQRGKGRHGVSLEQADALIGIVGHVVLHKAQLVHVHVQLVNIVHGTVAGHGVDGKVGIVGNVLGQHGAVGVVYAAGSAGRKGQFIRQRGSGAENHHQAQQQGDQFLHDWDTSDLKILMYPSYMMIAVNCVFFVFLCSFGRLFPFCGPNRPVSIACGTD